jgi:hypothetical protein
VAVDDSVKSPGFQWRGFGVERRYVEVGQVGGDLAKGAVRNAVGIRCGAFSGNMKVSFQAARSIG